MSRVKLANKIVDRAVTELSKGYRKPYAAALGATAGAGLLAKMLMPEVMSSTKTLRNQLKWADRIVELNRAKVQALEPFYKEFGEMQLPADGNWLTRTAKSSLGLDALKKLNMNLEASGKVTGLSQDITTDLAKTLGTYSFDAPKGNAMFSSLVNEKLNPLMIQLQDDIHRANTLGIPIYGGSHLTYTVK